MMSCAITLVDITHIHYDSASCNEEIIWLLNATEANLLNLG